jgi:hypothetical protein
MWLFTRLYLIRHQPGEGRVPAVIQEYGPISHRFQYQNMLDLQMKYECKKIRFSLYHTFGRSFKTHMFEHFTMYMYMQICFLLYFMMVYQLPC